MAEQEKQEQNRPTGEQAERVSETTRAGSDNQKGQSETEAEEQAGTEDERTGEGTGARAGEYS
jgi:hypothetical protein